PDRDDVQAVGGKELRTPAVELLDGEVGAACELEECAVRCQLALEEPGLEVELLERVLCRGPGLAEPLFHAGAVLWRAALPEETSHRGIRPAGGAGVQGRRFYLLAHRGLLLAALFLIASRLLLRAQGGRAGRVGPIRRRGG